MKRAVPSKGGRLPISFDREPRDLLYRCQACHVDRRDSHACTHVQVQRVALRNESSRTFMERDNHNINKTWPPHTPLVRVAPSDKQMMFLEHGQSFAYYVDTRLIEVENMYMSCIRGTSPDTFDSDQSTFTLEVRRADPAAISSARA